MIKYVFKKYIMVSLNIFVIYFGINLINYKIYISILITFYLDVTVWFKEFYHVINFIK